MIQFQRLKFKNILSFGNTFTEVDFSEKKSLLIQGGNANGKSSILEALVFSLFGKSFRKVNLPALVNYKNKKDLLVELTLTVQEKEVRIVRGINPAKFEIFVEDVLIHQSSTTKDYQRMLESSILKIDYNSFVQMILLGKSTYLPFLKLPIGERRKLIENILSLNVFGVMNDLNKKNLQDTKNILQETNLAIQGNKSSIDILADHIDFLEKEYIKKQQRRHAEKEERKELIEGEIGELENRKKAIKARIGTLLSVVPTNSVALSKTLDKHKSLMLQLQSKRLGIRKQLDFYIENQNCPTCGSCLNEEHKKSQEETLGKKEAAIFDAETELKVKVNSIKEEIQKIVDIEREVRELELDVKHLEKQQIQKKKDIELLIVDGTGSQDDLHFLKGKQGELDDLKATRQLLIEKKALIDKDINTMEVAALALKDTGIKSSIIRNYVPFINERMSENLSKLGLFSKFEINEQFEEKFYKSGFQPVDYYSFSEGERQRADIAFILTFRDISRVKSNLIMFDEILDGSLDPEGVESIIACFRMLKAEGVKVVIISHSDRFEEKFDNRMIVRKTNGFSEIEIQ